MICLYVRFYLFSFLFQYHFNCITDIIKQYDLSNNKLKHILTFHLQFQS